MTAIKDENLPSPPVDPSGSSSESVSIEVEGSEGEVPEGMSRTMAFAQSGLELTPTAEKELSPHDIMTLTQNLKEEEAFKRPLIAPTIPLTHLRSEYTSQAFLSKLTWLSQNGYTGLRRSRGDGDCFYRSMAFAYVERIMVAKDQGLAAASSLSVLDNGGRNCEAVGFEPMVFSDFYECLRDVIINIVQPDENGKLMTPFTMLERFQDPYISNSIVVFLRLLTSSHIRLNPSDFQPFLFDPETFEPLEIRRFCESQVEATGKEADHVQIQALSRALNVPVEIAYVDGTGPGGGQASATDEGKVEFVKFEVEHPDGAEPITLLYRPGHYDILEKKSISLDERPRMG